MATPPRTRTPSVDVRSALMGAAAHLLETEGPDALSVRRIAAAAHVAPMGVYNHFDGKYGIVEALWVDAFDRLRVTMESLAEVADPGEALVEGFRRYRTLAKEHPMAYRLMFLDAVPGFEPSAEATWTAACPSRDWWRRCAGPWRPAPCPRGTPSRWPRSHGRPSTAGSPSNWTA